MERTSEFMTPEVLLVALRHILLDLLPLWDHPQEAAMLERIPISIPFWVLLKVLVTIVVP